MLIQRNGPAFAAALLMAALAWAGDGHEHDHDAESHAPQAGERVQPRFYAASENFELVGVVDGTRVDLYLDHAADNSPVAEAALALEIGGAKLAATPHGEGEFEARLPQALGPGLIPVTATVIAQGKTDLLAGELDLHEAPHPGQSLPGRRLWIGGAVGAALALGWFLRRRGGRLGRKAGAAA